MVDEENHCLFVHTEPWKTNTGKLIWLWGSKINAKKGKKGTIDGWIFKMLSYIIILTPGEKDILTYWVKMKKVKDVLLGDKIGNFAKC